MMDLGVALAKNPAECGRSITAVTLPTRGFGAVLATTGFQIGSAMHDSNETSGQHLLTLRNIPIGKTVRFRLSLHGTKFTRGSFQGIHPAEDGSECIKVVLNKNDFRTLPLSQADRVQIAAKELTGVPSHSRFKELGALSQFGMLAIQPASPSLYAMQSGLDSVIIGQKNQLEREILADAFAISSDGMAVPGRLQDALLTRELLEANGSQVFRTGLIPTSSMAAEETNDPRLTVFDGARVFTKVTTSMFLDARWLVVLDRTSRKFEEAIELIDDRYIERRGSVDADCLPTPPDGIELTCFLRAKT